MTATEKIKMTTNETPRYYVPASSPWPIVGSIGLILIAIGGANFIQQSTGIVPNEGTIPGGPVLAVGFAIIIFMMFSWWRNTINESMAGMNSKMLDVSYRQGMMWFITSEVMFFAAFFGVLFYVRAISIPWLGGAGNNVMTHAVLWPEFLPQWPLTTSPGGENYGSVGPWGLPLINTILLLTSSITVTIAHHALIAGNRKNLILGLAATVALGVVFLFFQVEEYIHLYSEVGLTLESGVYGSTFFLLTGFHGMHVTIGTIMLTVMLLRSIKGHFTKENHFAFEATAWYWHFVDVVWLGLFIFVYIL
jgi:cytochrome c oxidase subunit 3